MSCLTLRYNSLAKRKKEAVYMIQILVDHENLVTISCFPYFFNLRSILHLKFLHLF